MTLPKWIIAGALATAAAATIAPARAQSEEAMRAQIEARMNVSGTIDIEPDGTVSAHAIEDAGEVPREVRDLIARAADTWRFEPVIEDGVAVPARASMHLKVVAEQVPGSEAVRLRLDGALFGKSPDAPEEGIRGLESNAPPNYPRDALFAGAGGVVYTVLRLDPDGTVAEAFAERVDLFQAGHGRLMALWRDDLSKAALRGARRWRFDLSGQALDDARLGTLTVRVPVEFRVADVPRQPGPWQAYIPGPEQPAPWLDEADDIASPDTVAGTDPYRLLAGHKLLTPLDPRG